VTLLIIAVSVTEAIKRVGSRLVVVPVGAR